MAPLDKSFSEPIREEEPTGKTPYSRNFFKELLHGPDVKNMPRKPEPSGSIFEKRKEGITRAEFREALKKFSDKGNPLKKDQRLELEKEMPTHTYSEHISKEDLQKHIDILHKEKLRQPLEKDKKPFEHKIDILKRIKDEQ